jgi:hypothetical protein
MWHLFTYFSVASIILLFLKVYVLPTEKENCKGGLINTFTYQLCIMKAFVIKYNIMQGLKSRNIAILNSRNLWNKIS